MEQNNNSRTATRARKPFVTALVSVLIAALAVFVLLPLTSSKVMAAPGDSADDPVTVSSWADLKNAAGNQAKYVKITGDIEADNSTLWITSDMHITGSLIPIIDEDSGEETGKKPVTISRKLVKNAQGKIDVEGDTKYGPMINVVGGTLDLGQNLTFSGKRGPLDRNDPSYSDDARYWWKTDFSSGTKAFFVQVYPNGALEINGATFEGYTTAGSNGSIKGRMPAGISPIYVQGDFTMNSGTIQNNFVAAIEGWANYQTNQTVESRSFLTWDDGSKAGLNGEPNVSKSTSDSTLKKHTAGAIMFDAPEKSLVINGGTLKANKATGGAIVVAGGSLSIMNGDITENYADHYGGGIFVASPDAVVKMCGGTVSRNESPMGGGVFVSNKGTFFLMGGKITENEAYNTGGGILVYSDNVHLISGTISNNIAPTFGGGVYVYGNDTNIDEQYTLVLHDAVISENEAYASKNDIKNYANLPMKGSDTISATKYDGSTETFMAGSGGGVWLCPAGITEFDASSLNIWDNTAKSQGDDFHKDAGFEGGLLLYFGPHDELAPTGDAWKHQELAGSWGNNTSGPKFGQPLTEAEATSGAADAISVKNEGHIEHVSNPPLLITGNKSLRGGGIGSNGSLFLTKRFEDKNIDKGELEFEKTFVHLDERPMEYEMILANANGDPVLDGEGNEITIAYWRLFDPGYAYDDTDNQNEDNYADLYRKNSAYPEFGQFLATWSDDYSKINLPFPQGSLDAAYFDTEDPKLYVIIREFEVKASDKESMKSLEARRGKQVSERFFKYKVAEDYSLDVQLDKEITAYDGTTCSEQQCDSCDPLPAEGHTFHQRYRTFQFDATAENVEPIEIEKYVNEAVHDDIALDEIFSYDILAYVPANADEVVITDSLAADLEFAPTDGNVKVYDLGMTQDDDGYDVPADSNHLPVYDISGKEVDNGNVTPSVKSGTEIDASKYTKNTNNNTLTITIANTLDEYGNPVDGLPQYVTDLRGHYVRIHFQAQIKKTIQDAILNGTKKLSDLTFVEVKDLQEEQREEPNKGNDPVKSDEDHTGIKNTASYVVKVGNEADGRYKDTSNTVTVKPETTSIKVSKDWNITGSEFWPEDTEITFGVFVVNDTTGEEIPYKVNGQQVTELLTHRKYDAVINDLPVLDGSHYVAREIKVTYKGNDYNVSYDGNAGHVEIQGGNDYIVSLIQGRVVEGGKEIDSFTSLNTTAEVEKYVNNNVHYEFENFDEVFDYTIAAFLPEGATELEITDTLPEDLLFVDLDGDVQGSTNFNAYQKNNNGSYKQSNLLTNSSSKGYMLVISDTNDHTVDGTVANLDNRQDHLLNEPITTDGAITLKDDQGNLSEDGKTIVVHIEENYLKERDYTNTSGQRQHQVDARGKWVFMTFKATINPASYAKVAQQIEAGEEPSVSGLQWEKVEGNGLVQGGKLVHAGVSNSANYKVTVGNAGSSEYWTNTVTVKPEVVQLDAQKKWKTAENGQLVDAAWPVGDNGQPAEVTFALIKVVNGTDQTPALETKTVTSPDVVTFTEQPKLERVTYKVVETKVENMPSNVSYWSIPDEATLTPATPDANECYTFVNGYDTSKIEKYVNNDVHASLVEFDKVIKYDIMAYVPVSAEKFEITDELVAALEFAKQTNDLQSAGVASTNADEVVSAVVVKDTNNHEADGTVAGADATTNPGTDIRNRATITIDPATRELKVTVADTGAAEIDDGSGSGNMIPNPDTLRGKWVQVTFFAKYTDDTITAASLGDTARVKNNGAVISTKYPTVPENAQDPSHEGTLNNAKYAITAPNNPNFRDESNTVTVDAETTTVEAEKLWKNPDGTNAKWPVDDNGDPYEVTVKVMNGNQVVKDAQGNDVTIKLTKDKPKNTSIEVPKLIGVTYTVDEATQVPGWYASYNGTVVTNTSGETTEVEKYVNNDVTYDFENFDQVFEYEIMGWVSSDATKVEFHDGLNEAIEFAPTDGNVKLFAMGTKNNHVNDVAKQGTPVTLPTEGVTVKVDANAGTLDVTVEGDALTPLKGQWVKVTFDARIKASKYEAVKAKIEEKLNANNNAAADSEIWKNIDDNIRVDIDKTHDGVPNNASYTLYVDNGGDFTDHTNTVTVEPKTTDLKVVKKWQNADETDTWPAGVTVDVTLKAMKGDQDIVDNVVDAADKTRTLTNTATTAEWKNLPMLEGVVYTAEEKKVTVPDDVQKDYKLESTTGEGTDEITFTNKEVEAAPKTSFEAIKVLLDADKNVKATAAGDYTFKLEAVTRNAPMPNVTEVAIDGTGKASFGEIEFPTSEGSYTYKISEVIPPEADKTPGLVYDETVVTVVIHVEKDEDGLWQADVEYHRSDDADTVADESASATFVNKELAPGTVTAEFETTKKLYDTVDKKFDTQVDANTFTFEIKAITPNAPMPQNSVALNGAGGKAVFGAAVYDEPGTYEYEISEIIPVNKIEGITYDETKIKAVVTVVEDPDDPTQLKASVAYTRADDKDTTDDETDTSVFVNKKGATEIEVTKFWAGGESDQATADNLISWIKLMRRIAENDTDAWEKFEEATPEPIATGTDGWTISFKNLPLYVANSLNKYVYSVVENLPVKDDGTKDFAVIYSDDDRALAGGSITNEAPEIEKYVNEDVHADIVDFDKEFTYDIMAYVTSDADKIEITDTLVNALEFADEHGNTTTDGREAVLEVNVKDTSDHKAGSSVATAGEPVRANSLIEGQTLTVTIDNKDDSQALRGKWVQVTFNARIKDTYRNIEALDEKTITDNGIVKSDITEHTGVTNKASYTLFVDNKASYKDESNTVTVTPEETELKVSKEWIADGVTAKWPQGAEVDVNVIGKKGAVVDSATLTARQQSYKFEKLPMLEGVEYTVVEAGTRNAGTYTIGEVQEVSEGEFKITNKSDSPETETEKYVNNDVTWDFENFDQVFEYEIMGYVPADATEFTFEDTLNGLIEFAPTKGNVKMFVVGEKNNHVNSVEKGTKVELPEGAVDVNGQKLTVTVTGAEAEKYRGQWMKLTFDAQFKADKYDDIAELVTARAAGDNWAEVAADENGTVEIDTAHDGIPNKATFSGKVANGGTFGSDTNTVTVEPKTTEVEVSKVWLLDGEDAGWPEGATVEVKLQANGKDVDGKTAVLTKDKESHKFEKLPMLEGVKYTVAEGNVENKGTYTIGEVKEVSDGVFKITNEATTEITEVPVTKIWDDKDDQDGKRPKSVTVQLYKDGQPVEGKTLELNAENQWKGAFTELVKYAADGKTEIKYTVDETKVPEGYTKSSIVGTEITNMHVPETINIEGTKTWDDKDNQDAKRPASIKVNLFANGKKIDSKEVKATDNWKYSFTELPKYDRGEEIIYAVTEDVVSEYSTEVTGYDIKNTYTPGKTSVTVVKAWEGDTAADRPEKITVQLTANGIPETGKTLELTKDNNWMGTFGDLDIMKNGQPVVYDIEEVETAGYTFRKAGSADKGFVITNTKEVIPETVKVPVSKKWVNNDGTTTWPADVKEIKINVLNGTEVVDTITLTAAKPDGESKELPKLENGNYTIDEETVVPGYKKSIDETGTVVINTEGHTEVEKYVNNDVTYDFEKFDQVFEYEIMGYVPEDATEVEFSDSLVESLEFVGENAGIKVFNMGTENNNINTVANEGTEITTGFTKSAKDGVLSVKFTDVTDETGIQGKWLKVTFNARITQATYDAVAAKVAEKAQAESGKAADVKNAWENVSDNKGVKIQKTHDGVPNKAGIRVKVENGREFTSESNTVTVEPETTEVTVSKEWMLDGAKADWPAGATVEVKVIGKDNAVVKTDKLTAEKQSVTFTDLPKLIGVTYTVAEGEVTNAGEYAIGDVEEVSAGVFKITNNATTPVPEEPAIEKYVNKDVHQDLVEFDRAFTYDIMAYVPADATKIEITDTLTDALEFANAGDNKAEATTDPKAAVAGVVIKDDNDHRAKGSVGEAGTAITAYTPDIKGKTLTVTIDNIGTEEGQTAACGKWVQVTFYAKYTQAVIDAANIGDQTSVTNNGAVISTTFPTHSGTDNTAEYQIYVGNNDASKYDKTPSNTVTVKPETTEVEVSKEWILDGAKVDWPAGATVEVKVIGKDNAVVKTDTLTDKKQSVTFTELPKLIGVTYTVAEGEVTNAGEYAIGGVEEVSAGVFKITNNATTPVPEEPAIEKYVNKDVHQDLVEFDRAFTYDIMAYVPADATKIEITDTLTDALEFANAGDNKAEATTDPKAAVAGVVIKDDNNHQAKGSVSEAGTAITAYTPEIDEKTKTLKVTIDNIGTEAGQTAACGKWVQVTFYAKYTQAVIDAANIGDQTSVTDNGAVISTTFPTHSGTDNTAEYQIYVGNNDASKYDKTPSNTVTVKPETETVKASKTWGEGAWPEAVAEVKVNVMNGDAVVDTLTLTKAKSEAESKELPKLIGVTYEVKEAEVPGYSSTVEYVNGVYKITNTKDTEKTRVEISKSELGGTEIEGAEIVLKRSDGTLVEEWTSTKESHVVELDDGTYYMEEVVAPEGYNKVTTTIVFEVKEGKVTLLTTEVNNGGQITQAGNHINLEDAPNKVYISKKAVGGGPELEGAKLEVRDSKGTVIEEWISGKEEKLIEKLPAGEYTLTEITAPDGYEVAETITFRIDEEGNVFVQSGDEWLDASEHIVMFDAPTPKPGPAPTGIVLNANKILEGTRYEEDGETVRNLQEGEFTFTLTGAGVSQTKTNAADGSVTFDEITYDKAGEYFYVIAETRGNDEGIIYDTSTHNVTVNVTEDTENNVLVASASYGTGGAATFTNKVVVPGSATARIDGIKHLTVNGAAADERLEAGEFTFTLSENGAVLDTTTNNADGSFSFETFTYTEAGTHVYEIAEVAGNEANVTYDATVYTVVVEVKDTTTDPAAPTFEAVVTYPEGMENGVAFTNDKKEEKEINISKVDLISGHELAGAELTVKDAAGNVVESWRSTGEVHKITLAPGSYTLTEDQAPLGYNIAETISFVVNEDGTVTAINSGKVGEDGKTLIMEDSSNTIRELFNLAVSIEKKWTDFEGKDAGWPEGALAEFTLEYYDNVEKKWLTYAPYGAPVTVTLTAEQPTAVFEELPAKISGNNAQYRAVETKIEGYTQATSTVADPGNYVGIMTAVNTPEVPDEFEVYISKNSLGGSEIEGAHIVIYDAAGSIVEEWDSTKEAHQVLLKPGSYTMVETVAPEGYQRVETAITFVVDANGHVILGTTTVDNGGQISVMEPNHLILEDAPVKEEEKHEVKISKTDLGGQEIEGARIVLKDDKGNVIDEWTSTKDAHIVLLPAGTYVMTETVAPEGFEKVTTEIRFSVDEDGKVTLLTTTVDNGGEIEVIDSDHIILKDAPVTPPEEKKDTPTPKEEDKPTPKEEDKPTPKTPDTTVKRTVNTPSTTRRVVTPSAPTVSRATSTGDNNATVLWIVLAAAAAAALAGAAVMVRRKRRGED